MIIKILNTKEWDIENLFNGIAFNGAFNKN